MTSNNPFNEKVLDGALPLADRVQEMDRVMQCLGGRAQRLLLTGRRRMGKSAILRRAAHMHKQGGELVVLADFSVAASAFDFSQHLLEAASALFQRSWADGLQDFIRRLTVKVELSVDETTGHPKLGFAPALKARTPAESGLLLVNILSSLNDQAAKRQVQLGMIIDEFQEIARFGDRLEWQLRSAAQDHHNINYVLSGSNLHLIQRMTGSNGAFYRMLDRVQVEPVPEDDMTQWIAGRVQAAGIPKVSPQFAPLIVKTASPRTSDIIMLARRSFDMAAQVGEALPDAVVAAGDLIVMENEHFYLDIWNGLSSRQREVLRYLAVNPGTVTSTQALDRIGLRSSGTVVNALRPLQARDWVEKLRRGTYEVADPFLKAWLRKHA